MFRAALEANAAHVQAHLDQQLALLETSEVAKAMAYSLQGGKASAGVFGHAERDAVRYRPQPSHLACLRD